MDNVTIEKLKRIHGDKAESVFREIADRGGFGTVGTSEGGIPLNYVGGLDIKGVLDPNNTAITEASKARIAELTGSSQEKAEKEAKSKEGK